MAILEKEVEISLVKNIKHYESLGYKIHKSIDDKGRLRVPRGSKLLVNVEDLPEGSRQRVTKVCDICGKKIFNQKYKNIIDSRKENKTGKDTCKDCCYKVMVTTSGLADMENCIATIDREFAKLFWNESDTYKYKCKSARRSDFKCPDCGSILENKIISSVYKQGLHCDVCSDNRSYPEKVVSALLKQLNIRYRTQACFKTWFKDNKKRYYDFYIESLNLIIEVHGLQHYEESSRGRSLDEEIENDILKKNIALKNGTKYVVIEAKKSEFSYLKESIEGSNLKKFIDLSVVEWNGVLKESLVSQTKEICYLYNNNYTPSEIAKKLGTSKSAVYRTLKNCAGTDVLPVYDPKKHTKKRCKSIVKLDLQGKFICEYKSLTEASNKSSINISGISAVCLRKHKRKTAGGFKWMYKEDYDKYIEQKNAI